MSVKKSALVALFQDRAEFCDGVGEWSSGCVMRQIAEEIEQDGKIGEDVDHVQLTELAARFRRRVPRMQAELETDLAWGFEEAATLIEKARDQAV